MKVAVLLGAGASFGAGPIAPEAPPLGGDLYARLTVAFPDTWGSLIEPVEAAALQADPPFEAGMELLWAKRDERVQRLIIDMARFFAAFEPAGRTHYASLLEMTVPAHQAVFCSLNYDCIFERVVWGGGGAVFSIGHRYGPLKGPLVQLLKPHGSCNYVMEAMANPRFQMTNVTMSNGRAYYDGPLAAIDPAQAAALYEAGPSVPPAISIYAPEKSSPVGAQAIKEVRRNWAELAGEAEVFIAIGARPVLADAHIWQPIIASGAPLWFVGGRDAAYDELAMTMRGRLAYLGPKFGDALPEIDVRLNGPVSRPGR